MLRFFCREYITSSIKQVQAKNTAYLIGFAAESALFQEVATQEPFIAAESALFQEVAISRTVHFQQKFFYHAIADSLKFH